ncbi:MAG: dihydroorotase [Candidatus Woesearchaeota archaeon]
MRIDPHVHFRDENQSYKETILHGLMIAESQGVMKVVDMPNCSPPILRISDVKRRLKLVPERMKDRYYMYIGATLDFNQLKEAVKAVNDFKEVVGIKMFAGKSTGDLQVLTEDEQLRIYKYLTQLDYKGVIAVHCEKESLMNESHFNSKKPITHAESRPNIAEVESLNDQISFIKKSGFKGHFHMVHVSVPECVQIIEENRKIMRISCAVTPHHLLWDDSKLLGEHGLLYKMNPPLRNLKDVIKLRQLLVNGKIDWIETDHAPHTIGEKLHQGFPSGYPTLYLYKDFVENFLPSLGLDKLAIKRLTYDAISEVLKI